MANGFQSADLSVLLGAERAERAGWYVLPRRFATQAGRPRPLGFLKKKQALLDCSLRGRLALRGTDNGKLITRYLDCNIKGTVKRLTSIGDDICNQHWLLKALIRIDTWEWVLSQLAANRFLLNY